LQTETVEKAKAHFNEMTEAHFNEMVEEMTEAHFNEMEAYFNPFQTTLSL